MDEYASALGGSKPPGNHAPAGWRQPASVLLDAFLLGGRDAGVRAALLFVEKGGQRDQKLGAKWGPNGIAVMGRMGINPQLVDVISPCGEGWEGVDRASSDRYAMLKALLRPCCMSERVLQGQIEPSKPEGERYFKP